MKALVFLMAMMLASPALAHKPFEWIMQNPITMSCCGPRDCRYEPAEAIRFDRDRGWFVRSRPVPVGRVYQSRIDAYVACYIDPGRWLNIRCLFVPGVS